ncbi:MAG TPA: hypothetical protein VFF81_01820 [Noviherbaspirillum sp.]|nr:hypothetical protein [Noviherbaspirillum sp.]
MGSEANREDAGESKYVGISEPQVDEGATNAYTHTPKKDAEHVGVLDLLSLDHDAL